MELESSLVLLNRARAGDREALDRLCNRYLPALKRWTRGRLPHWARDLLDTNDVVQEALVQTLAHLDGFEPRHEGALRAYLRQAVRHRIHDEIRRTRRSPARGSLPDVTPGGGPSPHEEAVAGEALERYEAGLRALRPADRDLVLARIELGLTYEEIAVHTGKPTAAAAQMAVSRALVRLARVMGHPR